MLATAMAAEPLLSFQFKCGTKQESFNVPPTTTWAALVEQVKTRFGFSSVKIFGKGPVDYQFELLVRDLIYDPTRPFNVQDATAIKAPAAAVEAKEEKKVNRAAPAPATANVNPVNRIGGDQLAVKLQALFAEFAGCRYDTISLWYQAMVTGATGVCTTHCRYSAEQMLTKAQAAGVIGFVSIASSSEEVNDEKSDMIVRCYPSHAACVFPFESATFATDRGYIIADPGCILPTLVVVRFEHSAQSIAKSHSMMFMTDEPIGSLSLKAIQVWNAKNINNANITTACDVLTTHMRHDDDIKVIKCLYRRAKGANMIYRRFEFKLTAMTDTEKAGIDNYLLALAPDFLAHYGTSGLRWSPEVPELTINSDGKPRKYKAKDINDAVKSLITTTLIKLGFTNSDALLAAIIATMNDATAWKKKREEALIWLRANFP